NAGGVTVSYLEWVQNRLGYYWTRDRIQKELKRYMTESFHSIHKASLEYNVSMRIAAFVVAINRVTKASELRGLS
ncbi:MAG: Glu/Leu/Phe/Val dehydrogenase, partial [Deltaproteobacteria bacterium]|nr:Glu/Leu/Phe/Val dehydrogenase [Deltaproteobacteria bacterium]